MKKLLKTNGLNSDMQYYEMIVNSVITGQIEQAKNQFLAMTKRNQLSFLKAGTIGDWDSGLSPSQFELFFNLI